MELQKLFASGTAAALLALSVGGASAATVISGSDQGGNFCENGINDCSITLESGLTTPAFAKYERGDGGSYTLDASIGSVGDFVITPIDSKSASFTYTVENGDLGLNAIYVKAGNEGGVLFTYDEGDFTYDATTMMFSGTFSTAGLTVGNNNRQPSISNVVFFDSFTFPGGGGGENPPPVPLPAAGFLLLAGLGGLAAAKRRKN